jgi:hypothetical protein
MTLIPSHRCSVTKEVSGEFALKGGASTSDEFGSFLQAGDDGYQQQQMQAPGRAPRMGALHRAHPHQRAAAPPRPKVQYVSRLQAVKAAVDAQCEALAKTHPTRYVCPCILLCSAVLFFFSCLSQAACVWCGA